MYVLREYVICISCYSFHLKSKLNIFNWRNH